MNSAKSELSSQRTSRSGWKEPCTSIFCADVSFFISVGKVVQQDKTCFVSYIVFVILVFQRV